MTTNGKNVAELVDETRYSSKRAGDWAGDVIGAAQINQQQLINLPEVVRERIAHARNVWSRVLFPTPKLEEWRYTNTDVIAKGPFDLPQTQGGQAEVAALLEKAVLKSEAPVSLLVFVDGVFSTKFSRLSQETGVVFSRLDDGSDLESNVGALEQHLNDPFAALATALISDCVCISTARGALASTPIQIVHLSTAQSEGCVLTPRLSIVAEEGSSISVIESHVGLSGVRYLALPMVELVAKQGAMIDYYKVQSESDSAFHLAGVTAAQDRNSEIRTQLFSFGGALVRNNVQSLLKGAGAQGVLNGLSLISGTQHVDNATSIHHIEPHAESSEHFKGIYSGASKGVFSGTITVDKIAQKTNAFQSNQALLLSSEASIETRPQLKIWADDVKCTHGATVGQLDSEALFYLRSRGIGEQDAKAFLVHAFASEVLSSIKSADLKRHLEEMVSAKLGKIL